MAFDEREMEGVRLDLTSPDDELRRLAVERIDVLPQAEAVARLVEALGDPSWRVRKAGVERFAARSATAEVVHALIDALSDGENTGRRNGAFEVLVRCGDRIVGSLVAALRTEDADVRKLIVDTLAAIGDPAAASTLVDLLADADPNVRAAATDALATVGGDGAAEALLVTAMHSEEDQLVRFSALRALGELEVPVRSEDLGSALGDPVLRPPALLLLGGSDDPCAIPTLLKGLSDRSRAAREAAMRALLVALSKRDGVECEALIREIREAAAALPDLERCTRVRLEEADTESVFMLVQFLGVLRSRESVLPILRTAGRDAALARVALASLEAMGSVAEDAIDGAWESLDVELRTSACELYGRRVGRTGAEHLMQALDSSSPQLRIAAARSVGRSRVAEALPLLVRRLGLAAEGDPTEDELGVVIDTLCALAASGAAGERDLRREAVGLLADQLGTAGAAARLAFTKVLGALCCEHDVPLVSFLLKDPEASVRRAAVHALGQLETGAAAESLRIALADESPGVRIAAAVALGSVGSDALIEHLSHLADDEDAGVRAAIARAVIQRFAQSDRPERRDLTRSILDRALADEAPVALAAAETVREVGGEGALQTVSLLKRSDTELVLEAVRCIGQYGEEAELLLPLVSHTDWAIRSEVIQILGRRGTTTAVPAILHRLAVERDEFVRGVILSALERLEA